MSIRIVFMGTPNFAVPALKALVEAALHQDWVIAGVLTQPDRPKGRGKKLTPPPVKVAAEQAGLPVQQPATLKTPEAVTDLAALEPDLIVVAAFGQILRKNVLELPPYGCLNVHASLLPRWRGASPITAAIQAGDAETGVTIMQMDVGLDTGPILTQRAMPIQPDHTGGTLTEALAQLGADLLVETLPAWTTAQIEPQPQDEALVTVTRLLKKRDGGIDWSQPTAAVERQVRALSPWPGTFTNGPRGQVKILSVSLADEAMPPEQLVEPGTVFKYQRKMHVVTGTGAIRLIEVQPAGKKAMAAEAMLNGQPELLGATLRKVEA